MRNVTKATVKFPCGTKEVTTGRFYLDQFGARKPERRLVEVINEVGPGETIDLEDGYCLPRRTMSGFERPSFLEEMGLADKLKPVEAHG